MAPTASSSSSSSKPSYISFGDLVSSGPAKERAGLKSPATSSAAPAALAPLSIGASGHDAALGAHARSGVGGPSSSRRENEVEEEAEEEFVSPLFDPSGLSSSSLSPSASASASGSGSYAGGPAGGWGTFDLDSVAARRLGLVSPAAQPPPLPPAAAASASSSSARTSAGRVTAAAPREGEGAGAAEAEVPLESSIPELPPRTAAEQGAGSGAGPGAGSEAEHMSRRGRRRRSSESLAAAAASATAADTAAGGMWWARGTATPPEPVEAGGGGGAATRFGASGTGGHLRLHTSSSTSNSLSASPSTSRSPAAEFLSSFSRDNSVYLPPPTPDQSVHLVGSPPDATAPAPAHAPAPEGRFQGFRAAATSMLGGTGASAGFGSPVPPSHRRIQSDTATFAAEAQRGGPSASSSYASLSHAGGSSAADPRSRLGFGFGARQRGVSATGELSSSGGPFSPSSSSAQGDSPAGPAVGDEGACIGPENRYMLGRVIAFGGFSTVREAFDLKDEASDRERLGRAQSASAQRQQQQPQEQEQQRRRRLAAKLIYSDASSNFGIGGRNQHAKVVGLGEDRVLAEMELWRDLPIHENILPLIWHERVPLNAGQQQEQQQQGSEAEKRLHAPAEAAAVDILVMPLCDRGSLLDFVRHEGKPGGQSGSSTASPAGGGTTGFARRSSLTMSRTSTLQSNADSNGSGSGQTASTLAPIIQGVAGVNLESSNDTRSGATTRNGGSRAASLSGAERTGLPATSGPSSLQAVLAGSSLASAFGSPGTASVGPSSATGGGGYVSRVSSLRRASSKHSSVRSRGLPIAVARDVMLQLARGLQVLHEKAGVLHADLKLENVIGQTRAHAAEAMPNEPEEGSGNVQWLIADFGLAMRPEEEADSPRHPSSKGELPRGGSMAYIAPEILRDRSPTEEQPPALPSPFASDMWALGCMLYALFSGKLPFSDPFEPRLQSKIIKGDWDMPQRLKRRGQMQSLSNSSSLHDLMQMKERSQSFAAPQASATNLSRAHSVGHRMTGASMYAHASNHIAHGHGDLSQSLSCLPPGGGGDAASHAFVVGSAPAPIRPSQQNGLEESEADADSDEDNSIDKAWNGTSADRVKVRQALRGLLQPDPKKRWDIQQLLSCAWLREEQEKDTDEGDQVAPLSFEKQETSPERGRGRLPSSKRSSSLSRSRPPPADRASIRSPDDSSSRSSQRSSPSVQERAKPAVSSRSRSAGRHPFRADGTAPEWSQSIMHQARVGSSPSTASLAERFTLRPSASRDSLHFKGFLPMSSSSGASSPAISHSDLAGTQSRGSPRGSTPIAIDGRSVSRSSRSSSAHGPRTSHASARSFHDDGSTAGAAAASYAAPSWEGSISEEHATRRSTSRSRTRAPDALASILDLDRAGQHPPRERERTIAESGEGEGEGESEADDAKDADEADERDRERGRARSRSRRR